MQNLPFANETFDFIYCSHVLEHIHDVEKAIGELHRILSKDGVALVAVPIWPQELSERYDTERKYGHWWQPGYDWFSKYAEAGFRVNICDPRNYNLGTNGLLEEWDKCALLSKETVLNAPLVTRPSSSLDSHSAISNEYATLR